MSESPRASAQRLLFGGYAWLLTVAPALLSEPPVSVATAACVLALSALVLAVIVEKWGGSNVEGTSPVAPLDRGRPSQEGRAPGSEGAPLLVQFAPIAFFLFSLVTWIAAPQAFSPRDRLSATAAVASWFLFAFISAGPAYPRPAEAPEAKRRTFWELFRRRAPLFVLMGTALAALIALGGAFGVEGDERRSLVILEVCGTGILMIAAAAGVFTDGPSLRRPGRVLGIATICAFGAVLFLLAHSRN